MIQKDFINEALEKILNEFPDAILYYDYKDDSDVHFIQVISESIFNNSGFQKMCFDITKDFYMKDIGGVLSFVDKNSTIDIKPIIAKRNLLQEERIFLEFEQNVSNPYFDYRDCSFETPALAA